ncbi:MAG: hypothetical protein AB8G96_06390 [Phycisphaerales bacterium]
MTIQRITSAFAACAVVSLSGVAVAGGPVAVPQDYFVIDFEGLSEATEVTNQFAALGVNFGIDGEPFSAPIICVTGAPITGFFSVAGQEDGPMSSGVAGLTDPLIDGSPSIASPIRMDFDPPVNSVSMNIIDIDGGEGYTLTALAGSTEVATMTVNDGDANAGDGVITRFDAEGAGITRVLIEYTGGAALSGAAIDDLRFSRDRVDGGGAVIQIAQESAPGAGDFDKNILGDVSSYRFLGDAARLYGYDTAGTGSWNGPFPTAADTSYVALIETDEGPGLVVVHDEAGGGDADGGRAEMQLDVLSGPGAAARVVSDDPADTFTGEEGDSMFTSVQDWTTADTDGFIIAGFALCGSEVSLGFEDVDGDAGTDAIAGLTDWVLRSADGTEIALDLTEGRRVRITMTDARTCPTDIDGDGMTGFIDLLEVLEQFNLECNNCPEDFNCDGKIDFDDILPVLSAWGDCP